MRSELGQCWYFFFSVGSSEFQRDGAMKLKERCPNDWSFRFGILSSFSLEDKSNLESWMASAIVGYATQVSKTCRLTGISSLVLKGTSHLRFGGDFILDFFFMH